MRRITVVLFLLSFLLIPFLNVQAAALSEEEQKEFEEVNGNWYTPAQFDNEKTALKCLKIFVKGNHQTIRWYQNKSGIATEEERKKLYDSDMAAALDSIHPKRISRVFDLVVEMLKTKREYPKALAIAARDVKFLEDKRVIPLLEEIVKHESLEVRLEAAGSLLALGDADKALPVLDELTKKSNKRALRYVSSYMKGKEWQQKGVEFLRKAMTYKDKEIKAEAMIELVNLSSEGLIKEDLTELEKIGLNIAEEILIKEKWEHSSYEYDDMRALNTVISAFWRLDSLKSIPILKRILEHPKRSFLEKHVEETIVKIQLSHCIEPEFKRYIKPIKEGRAYVTTSVSNLGILYYDECCCCYDSLERLLLSIKISVREIKMPQVSLSLAKELPVLIVPEGTLGKDFSDANYERLKAYVNAGGTLLVLSQPQGKSFSRLMKDVEAVGYEEDNISEPQEVSFVDRHPMFAGFYKSSFMMIGKGYFTKYPENAKVYLKGSQTNHPIFLTNPLGKGTVIATTSYTAVGAAKGKASEDEIVFFRELLNYLDSPKELQKVKTGQKVTLRIKVINENKNEKVFKVEVIMYDAEKAHRRFRNEFPIDLNPGESKYVEVTYAVCPTAMPGTWHTVYTLYGNRCISISEDEEEDRECYETALQSPKESLDGGFIVIK